MEFSCKIDDKIIFDCTELTLSAEKEKVFSDPDLTPTAAENNNLKLCKAKFNVPSTIFPAATPQEVIQGSNHLSQYLQLDEAARLDRTTEIFMAEYISKLNRYPRSIFCYTEPDFLDCARLSYWYYICLKNDNE